MRRNERGLALVTSILALMVLTGLAVGLVYMTSAETLINDNYRSSQQAYDAALAGLQNTRERMTPAATGSHSLLATLPTALPGTVANSILYVTNPLATETINKTVIASTSSAYYDKEICSELINQGLTTAATCAPSASSFTAAEDPATLNSLNYKWVRVALKTDASGYPYYTNNTQGSSNTVKQTQVCWDGTQQVLFGGAVTSCSNASSSVYTPVYQLTSMSLTPTNSTRMVQMEVALDPPLQTRGAVDSQDHVTLNGSLTVNGYDYCQCNCVTDKKGNTTCTNRTTGAACTAANSNYAIYASNTVDNPNSSETFISGQTPPVVQNQPWPYDLNSLMQQYATAPGTVNVTSSPYNWNCTSGCGTKPNANFGVPPAFPPNPPGNPPGMTSQVTYIPGDVSLTAGATGAGILIVNGNLDIHGGFNYYGLVIVTGVISFTGGGAQGVNIYGGIIAGQQSLVDNVLGGSAVISFDRCALPQRNDNQPPRVLAMRELTF